MSRGYFGIGMYGSQYQCNLGTLWRHAFALNASFIYTIRAKYRHQCSDTTKAYKHIPYFPYTNWESFLSNLPHNCQLVGIELVEDARPLETFTHPERAIYILGPENGSLGKKVLSKCHHVVKFDSKFCLNVAGAGTIVMYDRQRKEKINKTLR